MKKEQKEARAAAQSEFEVLFTEMEDQNRLNLIDVALDRRDKGLFDELTNMR